MNDEKLEKFTFIDDIFGLEKIILENWNEKKNLANAKKNN